jgi:hypothetical protein
MSSHVTKRGFFSTIWKWIGSRLIGRHPLDQKWKKEEWASRMWRQWWSFSSTSEA